MSLIFYQQRENTSNAKLTVQRTGRLGFSKGAMEMVDVGKDMFAKFGNDEEGNLFLVISKIEDEYSFKISKAGEYYYISAKNLLRDMGIDYKSKDTFIFDIYETEKENTFKMNKRVIKKE